MRRSDKLKGGKEKVVARSGRETRAETHDHDEYDEDVANFVLNECSEAENWLREAQQLQDTLPKYAERVLLSANIRKKEEAIDRRTGFIEREERKDKKVGRST
ncbi:hypothetical protein CTI12_AA317540 [Artemisia annua]|uniref:Uncharacterized protein n=1 Tax=Artemisia annua TaxID=35608 RepID=A0A2U1N2B2_ARTAN|nr:hypothetical protein CTI12_AA317540 [Artemisia annua]